MESDKARLLLESLLQRVEKDPESGKWRIVGPVSELEKEALSAALVALGGQPTRPAGGTARFVSVPRNRAAPLVRDSLKRTEPDNPEILLCLDFGTAMSKAVATVESDENLVDLALGTHAGDSGSAHGLRSSLFIARSGRVYLGHEAVSKSIEEKDPERRRFDSLKQHLSQGSLGDLSEGVLDQATNPTNVPLTHADAILLYLAYLTDVATSELVSVRKSSRYVRRRFARPCWDKARSDWAEGTLRHMLANAQVVADTFSGKWTGGLPLDVVKATLDAVSELEQKPEYLIDQGVPEPIAAASSSIAAEEADRGLFVVVDVGAGTTDYAAFWADQDPARGKFKVWQIPGTVDVLSQAGDRVDGFLSDYILEQARLRPGHTDYPFAQTRLSLEIRQIKERLIQDGLVDVILSNGTPVKTRKDNFMNSEAVKDLERLLEDKFLGVLKSIDQSWVRQLASFKRLEKDYISLVLTGGSSELPIVQALGRVVVDLHGHRFTCKKAERCPTWIRNNYPNLVNEYPQLAVAIGGAARKLPELAPEVGIFAGVGGKVNWELPTTYKK